MNSPAKRPNIILVMTDQQRGDCLGIAGNPHLLTPTLDGLGNSGAFFQNAYSECPICIPARHAIMTGKSPTTTGVTGFATKARIADEENCLPNLFRKAGYETATVGRNMHTYPHSKRYGFDVRKNDPYAEVYSKFRDIAPLSNVSDGWKDWPHMREHGMSQNGITARPWPMDENFHETNHAINRAIEFLDNRDKEAPFFLHVGTVAPHPPLIPPACYYDRYDRDDLPAPVVGDWVDSEICPLDKPPTKTGNMDIGSGRTVLEGAQLRSTRAGYYGLINHFDDQLQLLLRRLSTEGLMDNTYIVFTSDHGEMLGDHHCFRKSTPYEGAAHIPFILHGPGIAAGTRVETPVVLMDILPTCCELAGIILPDTVEGRSLVGLLKGGETTKRIIHGSHSEMDGLHGGFHYLTDGHHKYIWWVKGGQEQLFNLDNDPQERMNLAPYDDQQDTLLRFREELIQRLANAPEGFVKDGRLVAGLRYDSVNSNAVVDA